jgi:hypothetical protein
MKSLMMLVLILIPVSSWAFPSKCGKGASVEDYQEGIRDLYGLNQKLCPISGTECDIDQFVKEKCAQIEANEAAEAQEEKETAVIEAKENAEYQKNIQEHFSKSGVDVDSLSPAEQAAVVQFIKKQQNTTTITIKQK